MPADDTAPVDVQADALAEQTLGELDALDAALRQVDTLPPEPEPASTVPQKPEETLPLGKRKEYARTAASRIGDIVKLGEADAEAAQVQPPPVPAVTGEEREQEIGRIKAGLNP